MSEPEQMAMLAAETISADIEVPAQRAYSTDARASGLKRAERSEQWARIPGFQGYEASTLGNVRSVDRYIDHGYSGRSFRRGRVLKQDMDELGYCRVSLGRQVHNALTSRLVAMAFHGTPKEGQVVRHLDGDPTNNRPENLRWGTQAENMQDAIRHGTLHALTKGRCPRGHLLTAPNLVASQLKVGRRECKSCANARIKLWWADKEGRPHVSLQEESDDRYARIMQGLPK